VSAPWQGRALTVLGATGSIGTSTLDVAARLGIPVHGLSARSRIDELAAQCREHRPAVAVVPDAAAAARLRALVPGQRVEHGPEALDAIAADPAVGAVITAIVGAAGLAPTLAAVRAGKRVGIANKEPLVMAGALIMAEAARCGAAILPVDSEHSAIFQCLEGHRGHEVAELLLTASGGPFRTVMDLSAVTREQALKHPTWTMGPKITIDSASLMNKALEVVEARWLFGIGPERIRVLVHPQSVVHSMVAYRDGSVMAQLGRPDMRTPIQYALTFPEHTAGPVAAPDFATLAALTFEEPDRRRFPSIDFAYAALRTGGAAPAALNAANEVAVQAFLDRRIPFTGIFRVLERVLALDHGPADDLGQVVAADQRARILAAEGL
jgi:1-deoxy-D-xylulose-5-phosphate reductoisomerase